MISGRVELLSCEAESFTVGVSCREGKRCIPRFQWLTEKDTEGFFLVASMSINLSTSTLMCLFDIYNHLQLYIYIFTYKTYPCITITYYNHNQIFQSIWSQWPNSFALFFLPVTNLREISSPWQLSSVSPGDTRKKKRCHSKKWWSPKDR